MIRTCSASKSMLCPGPSTKPQHTNHLQASVATVPPLAQEYEVEVHFFARLLVEVTFLSAYFCFGTEENNLWQKEFGN